MAKEINEPRSLSDLGRDFYQIEELADKVMSGVKLTLKEKQLIYERLTGKKPPRRILGRKTEKYRDMRIASGFLTMKKEGKKTVKKIIMELGKLHRLPGLEDVAHPTFYKALNKGIGLLDSYARQWLDFAERDDAEWSAKGIADAKEHIALIEEHLKSKTILE